MMLEWIKMKVRTNMFGKLRMKLKLIGNLMEELKLNIHEWAEDN